MLRTRFASYLPQIAYAPADAGSAGNTDPAPKTDDQQPNGKDNEKDNVDPFVDLWQNKDDKGEKEPAPARPDPIADEKKSASDFMQEHIKGIGITDGIDPNSIMKDLNDGKQESFMDALHAVGAKSYQAALTDSATIIDNKVAKAKEEIIAQVKGETNATSAVRAMNQRFKFTENPAVAPIAKVTLAQLMSKGLSQDKAVEQVGEFLKHMHKVSAKELGLNTSQHRPGSGEFGNDSVGDDDDDGQSSEDKWVELLSGKS